MCVVVGISVSRALDNCTGKAASLFPILTALDGKLHVNTVCVCVCVCACVRACVRACMRVSLLANLYVHTTEWLYCSVPERFLELIWHPNGS